MRGVVSIVSVAFLCSSILFSFPFLLDPFYPFCAFLTTYVEASVGAFWPLVASGAASFGRRIGGLLVVNFRSTVPFVTLVIAGKFLISWLASYFSMRSGTVRELDNFIPRTWQVPGG